MSVASVQKRTGYLVIGGAGVFLAAGYLGLSLQLPMGRLNSPGAAIFPLIAGGLFLFGSLSVIWEGWKMDRAEVTEFPAGEDAYRLLAMVAAIIFYLVSIPWLGQLLSSVLFCVFLMKILSENLSYPGIVIRSVILMLPIYYLFIQVFRVPMPRGIFF